MPYCAGELGGIERAAVRLHVRFCAGCFARYEDLERAGSPLAALAAPLPPSALGTQIRAALSVEIAQGGAFRRRLSHIRAVVREGFRPFALRAVGGSVSALLLFSALMPDLWSVTRASTDDVPLTYMARGFITDPTLNNPGPYQVSADTTVLVYVDMRGGIYGFDLPAEQNDDVKLRAEVANALLFTAFEPATVFGKPVPGRLVLKFTSLTVKG